MDDTLLPEYAPDDPRNCFSESGKRRMNDAYLEAEKIRTRTRADLHARYSSEKNRRETFAEYLSHGQAGIKFNQSLLEAARVILASLLREYRNAGKSRRELRELITEEVETICYCYELPTVQRELLEQELDLFKSEPVQGIAKGAMDAASEAESRQTKLAKNLDRLKAECGWSFVQMAQATDLDKKLILGHVNKGKSAYPDTLAKYAKAFSKKLEREVSVQDLQT